MKKISVVTFIQTMKVRAVSNQAVNVNSRNFLVIEKWQYRKKIEKISIPIRPQYKVKLQ